jgi:hypothetical protein
LIDKKYIKENGLELFEDTYMPPDDSPTLLELEVFEEGKDPSGVVDGVNILGRATGVFFVVDSKSQNNRFYEKRLWERVLKDTESVRQKGQMLGTIGHQQPLDDNALLEGKASHRISKLWIDENKKLGMGEILILNTPAGRTLNALLRGGVQFPVSSRGYGKYNGAMEDGTQIVDAESYKLETFDFVRVPGIPNAVPTIVENKEEDIVEVDDEPVAGHIKKIEQGKKAAADDEEKLPVKQESKREVTKMEDTVLRKMTEEKIALEQDLRSALETNVQLSETIDALKGQVSEVQRMIEEYRSLGSIEEIGRVMDVTESMLEDRPVEESEIAAIVERLEVYEQYGTPEELEELFDKFESYIDQYEELGHPEEISQALDGSAELLEAYKELGNPESITEAFDATEIFMSEMAELGTLEELHAVCDLLEAYQPYGTPSELSKAFAMMEAVVENTRQKHLATESKALATEFGVDATVAESMVESMGSARAKEVLGAINESRSVTSRYKVGSELHETKEMNEDGEGTDTRPQGLASSTLLNRNATTRVSRLFEQMSR